MVPKVNYNARVNTLRAHLSLSLTLKQFNFSFLYSLLPLSLSFSVSISVSVSLAKASIAARTDFDWCGAPYMVICVVLSSGIVQSILFDAKVPETSARGLE